MIDTKLAQKPISFLSRRKGFDGWWQSIDEEIREEITQEMAERIDEYIEFNYR